MVGVYSTECRVQYSISTIIKVLVPLSQVMGSTPRSPIVGIFLDFDFRIMEVLVKFGGVAVVARGAGG
ncbi:hypothetical protein RIF29_41941 [Crotalaria pallida]|uniref:Uncharacterized protein n=1 Tax=Crotalaria pallida TaxID=3830 RepID=A0AAN9HPV5_CROPI